MALFGSDPKDQIIELLNGIVTALREENSELRRQNMAYGDARAYAQAFPRATIQVPRQAIEPAGLDIRDVPYKPSLSRDEIEKQFKSA